METPPTERLDDIFDILSNQRRRFVLGQLSGRNSVVDVERLARDIAAWETRQTGQQSAGEITTAVETSLRHVHLPKLAAANLITHSDETGQIELTDAAGLGLRLLETSRAEECDFAPSR